MSSNLLFRLSPTRLEKASNIDGPLFGLPDIKGSLELAGVYLGPLPATRNPKQMPYRYRTVLGKLETERVPPLVEETLNHAYSRDTVLLVSWDTRTLAGLCLHFNMPRSSRFFDRTSPKRIFVLFDIEILQPIEFYLFVHIYNYNNDHEYSYEYPGSRSPTDRRPIAILLDPMIEDVSRYEVPIDICLILISSNNPIEMYFSGANVYWVD